jgi:hypothetical protein
MYCDLWQHPIPTQIKRKAATNLKTHITFVALVFSHPFLTRHPAFRNPSPGNLAPSHAQSEQLRLPTTKQNASTPDKIQTNMSSTTINPSNLHMDLLFGR